ncbi:fimbrillin family protein [Bacteroides fragilis]|nr:fimbrillin family protein [Bacteroides fragilis]
MNSSTIYIKGYYPAGTLAGKSVTFAADGTEDVMITAQASGTKATATPLSFIFNHLLTQLQFKFVSGTGYPASGVNVTSLVIKQQKAPATLDLNTAAMTYTTKDLTLSGTFPITTAGATVSNYPMVKSGEALSVAVTTSDGVTYPETAISITTEAGKSHLITLTFTPKEITAAISVTAWQVGGQGSSSLQ